MTGNRKNWLYPEAYGLYFPHDGFVMRATDGKQYDIDEECELLNELHDENEQLKSDYDTLKIQDDARKQHQKELMKENEELKKEVKQLKNKINTYHEGNKTLHQTLQKYWEDRYNE